jgi:predicted RNA-binding Zn-ribbon protein involved in translation (DUF1610 family)
MPNWAEGDVTIVGKKENIKKFINRFVFDSDDEEAKCTSNEEMFNKKGIKFFSGSIIYDNKEEVIEMIDDHAKNSNDDNLTIEINCDFAWSARSCLIDEVIKNVYGDYCIPLSDACKEDGVSVNIETIECGNKFEESIACDENGNYTNTSKSMSSYKCNKCGEIWAIPSRDDLNEYGCPDCGASGENTWALYSL